MCIYPVGEGANRVLAGVSGTLPPFLAGLFDAYRLVAANLPDETGGILANAVKARLADCDCLLLHEAHTHPAMNLAPFLPEESCMS